jgi:tRNA (Thr-GGU) A37 N-methylase
MDALDGSILLDIKPYSAGIDSFPDARIGWQREDRDSGQISEGQIPVESRSQRHRRSIC